MAISLKSFMVLVIISSLVACGRMNINPIKDTFSAVSNSYAQIFIGFGTGSESPKPIERNSSYGHHCFKNGDQILLTVNRFYQSSKDLNFYIAFDSQEYLNITSYSDELSIPQNGEICVIWGSWIPEEQNDSSKNNQVPKKEAEIYFNILTSQKKIQNGYLFLLGSTINTNDLEVYLVLDILDSKIKPNPLKEKITFLINIENIFCNDSNARREKAKIGGQEYTHKGTGRFVMFQVANDPEDEYVKESIEVFLNTPLDKRYSLSNKALNILKCTNFGFEFNRPYSYVPKADLRTVI